MPFECSYCLIGVSLISWCPSGLSGEKIEKRIMRWIPRNSVFAGKLIFTQPIDKRTRLPFNQGNQNKVFCIFPVFSSPSYEAFRSPPSDVEMFPPNGPHLRRCRPVLVVVPVCFFCYCPSILVSPHCCGDLLWYSRTRSEGSEVWVAMTAEF